MNLIFSDQAWDDYQFWQQTDKKWSDGFMNC